MQLLIRKGFAPIDNSTNKLALNSARDPTTPRCIVAKNIDATRDNDCGIPLSQYNLNYVFSPCETSKQTGQGLEKGGDEIPSSPFPFALGLPPRTEISNDPSWILDQGTYGASVANAVAYSIRAVRHKRNLSDFPPSRFFLYYFARLSEGRSTDRDTGVYISSVLDAMTKNSVCSEGMWAYDDKKIFAVPSEKPLNDAATHERMGYASVPQEVKSLKTLLLHGYPIIFGFTVFASFMSAVTAKTGKWNGLSHDNTDNTDNTDEENGGQAAVIVGYDDTHDSEGAFIVVNSFSRKWGTEGKVYVPYSYVLNSKYARDFHTLYIS